MRPTIAYYLLLLYTTVMLKPLLPIISDAASHFFEEAYHQATVHAKYGAHHVDAEMASAGAGNDDNKHPFTIKTEDPVPPHLFNDDERVVSKAGVYKPSYPYKKPAKLPLRLMIVSSPPPKYI